MKIENQEIKFNQLFKKLAETNKENATLDERLEMSHQAYLELETQSKN